MFKFIRISVLFGLPLWITFGSAAFGARVLLPDPFFRRYDLAAEIVEATLIEVTPSPRRIKDKMFEKFPDDSFMVAKIKVVKSWKGKLKVGDQAEFKFVRLPDMTQKDRVELAGARVLFKVRENLVLFLRSIGKQLVGAELFGFSTVRADAQALEAVKEGKSEAEAIKIMDSFDRHFYEEQLRRTGKIDRMAERPEWAPPPKGVQI